MSNEDNNNNDDDLLPHQVVVFTRMVRAQLAAEKHRREQETWDSARHEC